jgi:hypothetical protein
VISHRATYRFDLAPAELWARISRFDEFRGWWGSWLREFSFDGPLADGTTLRLVVVPPLPYRMRVDVALQECEPPHRVHSQVSGDLHGVATLDVAADGAGCAVTVAWQLEMMQRPMRLAARFARPVLQWGHDRVVEVAVSRFRRQLRRGP